MKKHYVRPTSSHTAAITSLQRKGGDIESTWLANCRRGNVRLAIKNQHALTISVGFGFPFLEKKHPAHPSWTPVTV
jgi:hypothetical protein